MYIIPVTPFTLDLIQSLNGEVRPVMQTEITYFVFRPHGENTIVTRSEFLELYEGGKPTTITYYPS